MKRKPFVLPLAFSILGGLGFLLYRLTGAATDALGLVVPRHPAVLALWGLTLLALAGAIWAGVKFRGPQTYDQCFPAGALGALGQFLLGLCLGVTAAAFPPAMDGAMGTLWRILGLAAAAGALHAGFCRFRGKNPGPLGHLAVCLFLAVHVLSHYQVWSSTPNLLHYFFPMTGAIALVFFAYCHAASAAALEKGRMLELTGLLSLYLGAVAAAGSGYPLLYLGGVLWAAVESFRLPREKVAP